jgi:calcium/calmodulin-dependent protein kinase I
VVEHGPDWWIKIGDFGISKRVEDHQTAFRTFNGTMGFIAPEILGLVETEPGNEGYTVSVDIWAMGVIAFRILTGKLPIPMERLADYVRGKLNFPGDILETHHVSVEGCEFVGGLMMPHPNDRMTADKALLHAWLKKVNSPSPRNSADIQG